MNSEEKDTTSDSGVWSLSGITDVLNQSKEDLLPLPGSTIAVMISDTCALHDSRASFAQKLANLCSLEPMLWCCKQQVTFGGKCDRCGQYCFPPPSADTDDEVEDGDDGHMSEIHAAMKWSKEDLLPKCWCCAQKVAAGGKCRQCGQSSLPTPSADTDDEKEKVHYGHISAPGGPCVSNDHRVQVKPVLWCCGQKVTDAGDCDRCGKYCSFLSSDSSDDEEEEEEDTDDDEEEEEVPVPLAFQALYSAWNSIWGPRVQLFGPQPRTGKGRQATVRFNLSQFERRDTYIANLGWSVHSYKLIEAMAVIILAAGGDALSVGSGPFAVVEILLNLVTGVTVQATDAFTTFNAHKHAPGRPYRYRNPHITVDHMPALQAVNYNVKANVLIFIWPGMESWPAEALRQFMKRVRADSVVLYIGEGDGGCTADDTFHNLLRMHWNLIRRVDVEQWWGLHDDCRAYRPTALLVDRAVQFRGSCLMTGADTLPLSDADVYWSEVLASEDSED
jgi:hypothetical protein